MGSKSLLEKESLRGENQIVANIIPSKIKEISKNKFEYGNLIKG